MASRFSAAIQVDQGEAMGELRLLSANPATLLSEAIKDGQLYLEKAAAFRRRLHFQLTARHGTWFLPPREGVPILA